MTEAENEWRHVQLMGMGMEESSTKDTAAVDEENNGSGEYLYFRYSFFFSPLAAATSSRSQRTLDLTTFFQLVPQSFDCNKALIGSFNPGDTDSLNKTWKVGTMIAGYLEPHVAPLALPETRPRH
ncbi:uncharacterized protein STEHIDRAFT_116157 [Stereum hirsutum FP-91666 SS1]|uniref:Uncharacterized protein n=1 Tax=Stereum hirsutum (strain FP-91666) TaxID=721885 RepID=R7RYQ1_STEHR|nr:uncharacterized protein STEHIDRAFT_116157 [Stereum hirsutum FP-91666 SS1]EIM79958.1 hypothetical protein STEHIDRAFT_116157 [Stereum hirsutum FP-91666 SS1]